MRVSSSPWQRLIHVLLALSLARAATSFNCAPGLVLMPFGNNNAGLAASIGIVKLAKIADCEEKQMDNK
eukprot:m.247102 g.247102  ORF g.247102 m.247102 type:complete len:69 (+) comp22592_c1_seq5:745-951(+)